METNTETERARLFMVARGISDDAADELAGTPGVSVDLLRDVFERAKPDTGFGAIIENIKRRARAAIALARYETETRSDSDAARRRTEERLANDESQRKQADAEAEQNRELIEAAEQAGRLGEYVDRACERYPGVVRSNDPRQNPMLAALVADLIIADGFLTPGTLKPKPRDDLFES